MPSKIVTALAAGAMVVASSSALAQTASTQAQLPALLQSDAGESGTSTALIVAGVLAAIGLLIWATGDDDAPGVSP